MSIFVRSGRTFCLSQLRRSATRSPYSTQVAKPNTRWFWRGFGLSLVSGIVYWTGSPTLENPSHSPQSYLLRCWYRFQGLFKKFEEPVFEKLLPDRLPEPASSHPRSYTLVIDLDEFLVHHLWDRDTGRWRIAKRPGAELFLFYAAQLYELVVFSSMPQHEGDAIVKGLDRFGCITHALYRFATHHKRGTYLKVINFILGHQQDEQRSG